MLPLLMPWYLVVSEHQAGRQALRLLHFLTGGKPGALGGAQQTACAEFQFRRGGKLHDSTATALDGLKRIWCCCRHIPIRSPFRFYEVDKLLRLFFGLSCLLLILLLFLFLFLFVTADEVDDFNVVIRLQ